MQEKKREGERSICNRERVSCDGDIVTEELLKDKCNCIHKNTCFKLINLLLIKKPSEAEDLLDEYKKTLDK